MRKKKKRSIVHSKIKLALKKKTNTFKVLGSYIILMSAQIYVLQN